jgi:iron-sulfur cluster repair protein YtfE (RIC family)
VNESRAQTLTGPLTAEHRRFDDLVGQLRAALAAGQLASARAPFAELDVTMRRHLRVEEEVVFPLFEARTRIAGPVEVMRREHLAIEALLELVRAALDRGERAAAAAAVAKLDALLGPHHLKEERILYPKTDRVVDDAERAQVLRTGRSG